MTEDLGWRDATIEVLRTRGEAMHYKDIAEAIKENGLREIMGATPAAAVFTAIRLSMKKFPETTPFIKTGDGWFLLKSDTGHPIELEVQNQEVEDEEVVANEIAGTVENEDETLVQAFGMYWERSLIAWKNNPKLFGIQQTGALPVNFSEQRGIYLLHDGSSVVYVGRVIDQSMGNRLFQHNSDRLRGRWNRFSWFGLRKVLPNGTLVDTDSGDIATTQKKLIATLEAILIEGLEPPQNRKRGDDIGAIEYLQGMDPKIKEAEMSRMVESFTSYLKDKNGD
jgi:hypothetical protein